ncbi:hypothetical protein KM92CIT3_81177 [uncultured Citrobacter sp.]|uniref:Uncharacterized protein n=1 Tax=uncultured Citrobacter sp. TaxID=200446 RepID=A0A212IQT0_9ENTR|nr:hypothetical protein KL86CIT2_390210 [uncultured Citrobacter sp.]SBV68961.1 hypothetical protein KM92CIT3_81177 [uncultured Citrobacter sp.]
MWMDLLCQKHAYYEHVFDSEHVL